ncbi:MAG: phosphoribosylformylglycinamidine synthase subunit PurQ [Chitinophagales bacterium]|nr:phosphoribosylformylglycinamidine synthase subunit PurQ [Chitinophagales bacterium]
MKFGVVTFPGSNCDHDIAHVCEKVMQAEVRILWHKDTALQDLTTNDCIMIPGGFSYGDYLRCGAIARFSPIMEKIIEHANNGGFVWGICNGFQILCEAHLLPGALLRNKDQRFICQNQYITTTNTTTPLTKNLTPNQALSIPIAHAEGRYFADDATLQQLQQNNQIIFQYCDANGNITDESNPNGSVNNIAGICNANKNVFGMMPHPERAAETILGNKDGKLLFESLLDIVHA